MRTMTATGSILARGKSWRGAKVGVLGLGRSGQAAAGLLLDEGCRVVLFDDRTPPISESLRERLEEGGHRLLLGDSASGAVEMAELDALIVSPGVGEGHPRVLAAERAGIPIWSELELASRRIEGPIILVTGTNGKSTTVSLIHHLLQTAGRRSLLAGNIGTALSEVVEQADPDTITVVEASSFQLERIETLHPQVAVLLNLAPDHLDRYRDVESYAAAKRRMLENLDENDTFVFPAGDPTAETWSAVCSSRQLRFQLSADAVGQEDGTSLKEGWLVQRSGGREVRVLPASRLPLLGAHNLLNSLAALAALLPFSLPLERLREGLEGFRGLPHRVEGIGRIDGVLYVNDSKATNVHATTAALEGLNGPIVLLLGGRGKGEDYSSLKNAMGKVRAAVCYGEEGEKLASALLDAVEVWRATGLEDALTTARQIAGEGDVVLLSPACSSYDEFSSFQERGECFRRWVQQKMGGAR